MVLTDAPEQLWLPLWAPRWPLAGDDLATGVYRMSREQACGRRYVEANPQSISNLLVVDCDHPDAVLRAVSSRRSHALPNAVVENPRNGHAHAVWALSAPFPRTEYARRKPLAYAAAVTEGLRRALDGDRGYSGLLTKNPLHQTWRTEWLHTDTFSLDQLAQALDEGGNMPPARWRQQKSRKANPEGLGRNCALFDSARRWAYRAIPNHWGDPDGLAAAIQAEVQERNNDFTEPLPASEARAIAASITRWILTRSRMWADGPVVYEATFSTIQSARAKKRGEQRRAAHQQIIDAARGH